MYKCEHFDIEELVPEDVFNERGEKCWELLDEDILADLDTLRDLLGPLTINDWKWGGGFQYSGFRPEGCGVGSKYSQHKLGKAFDLKSKDHTVKEMHAIIRDNEHRFCGITRVEDKNGMTWLHVDGANRKGIYFFKP